MELDSGTTTEMALMQHGEKSLVSVIIPTYHHSQYLPTAILSVLAQTYKPIELVIVSVIGDEETHKVVDRFQTLMDIRHVKSEKPDHIHQINLGLEEATGEFTVLFGSDDFMLPNKIDLEMSTATAANAVLVYSRLFYTDDKLNIGAVAPMPNFSYMFLVQRNFIVDSCLVSKRMYEEFGTFDEALGSLAVYDKWLHIAEKYEGNIIFNPVPVILYRTHPQQKHVQRLADPHQVELYERVVKASLTRKGLPTDKVKFRLITTEVERI